VKEVLVPCPHGAGSATVAQRRRTAPGQRPFRCSRCRRICNARTGTPDHHRHYPPDLALLVVLWRRRDTLRLRDLAEMFVERGFGCSHEAVRDRAARCAPLLAAHLRAKRRGQGGTKWHVDETYIKVNGQGCYLYRAIDRDGNLVDARLGERRDMTAARRCFAQALDRAGRAPEQGTTDGHDAYPRAIRETLGPTVGHRTSREKNNRIAQDHRSVQPRDYPLRGVGSFASVARCCTAFAEQRQYRRAQSHAEEYVSLAERRRRCQDRWGGGDDGASHHVTSDRVGVTLPRLLVNNTRRPNSDASDAMGLGWALAVWAGRR